MGLLNRFFEGGEEGVIKKYNTIVEIATEANKTLARVVAKGGSIEKIRIFEKRSDSAAFEIANMITHGGIAPNLIGDMLELTDKEDNIVDSIYNLARELKRHRIRSKRASELLKRKILDINELTLSALTALHEMQETDDLAEVSILRKRIEDFEEAGDEIKDGLLDYAYSAKFDFKDFHHVMEMAHKADDVLDSCEDSADLYTTVMSSVIT